MPDLQAEITLRKIRDMFPAESFTQLGQHRHRSDRSVYSLLATVLMPEKTQLQIGACVNRSRTAVVRWILQATHKDKLVALKMMELM